MSNIDPNSPKVFENLIREHLESHPGPEMFTHVVSHPAMVRFAKKCCEFGSEVTRKELIGDCDGMTHMALLMQLLEAFFPEDHGVDCYRLGDHLLVKPERSETAPPGTPVAFMFNQDGTLTYWPTQGESWADPYTWIHHRAETVECSACHRSVPRASTIGPEAAEPGWGSLGKGLPPHMLGEGESNPPFAAWSCPGCIERATLDTGKKVGDEGWFEAHSAWLAEQAQAEVEGGFRPGTTGS